MGWLQAADQQPRLNVESLAAWAAEFGVGLTLSQGWDHFVEQALFWAALPKPEAANKAVGFIHERLLGMEAAPPSVALWETLTRG